MNRSYAKRASARALLEPAVRSKEPGGPTRPPHQDRRVLWDIGAILFSACNENSRSELSALGSLTGKNVFCVTAGGGRVLNLLVDHPSRICAVDLNRSQNALLELKVAAMRHLRHDEYLRFLGVRPDADRRHTYAMLRKQLSPATQRLFDENVEAIRAGILFEGKLERYLKRVAATLRLGRHFGLKRLIEAPDLQAQCDFLDRIETPLWRTLAQTLCRRSVLELFSGDPGFFRFLPPELPLHQVLYARVLGYLRQNLLRDNPLLQLVFFGAYVWEPALPIYLNRETYGVVQGALECVELEIVTSTVDDALDCANKFDAFSLSDVSSYLDDAAHHRLFERVLAASTRGTRFCSRSTLHHRNVSPELARQFERDPVLEAGLGARDHACVHAFLIGRVP